MLNTGHIQAVFVPKAQNPRIDHLQRPNMKESRHFCVGSGACEAPFGAENSLDGKLNTASPPP